VPATPSLFLRRRRRFRLLPDIDWPAVQSSHASSTITASESTCAADAESSGALSTEYTLEMLARRHKTQSPWCVVDHSAQATTVCPIERRVCRGDQLSTSKPPSGDIARVPGTGTAAKGDRAWITNRHVVITSVRAIISCSSCSSRRYYPCSSPSFIQQSNSNVKHCMRLVRRFAPSQSEQYQEIYSHNPQTQH